MGNPVLKTTQPELRHGWQVWWRLLRPHTLTASFIPVFVGTTLALQHGPISIGLFMAMLLASLLIQAATNMFNEYYDYKRGLDNEKSVGIGGAIVREGVKPEVVLNLGLALFGVAVILGVYICIASNWWVAVAGSLCMLVGYLYTGGPYPIANSPFGELFAGIMMGPVIIGIAFFIQTGMVTAESILISIPVAVLCGAILTSNNIRDREGDQRFGRRTLAILLGHDRAVLFLGGMFGTAYLWVLGMVLFGVSSPWLLLVFGSLPKAVQAIRLFQGKKTAVEMVPAMKATAQLHTLFGLLLAAGILLNL